MQHRTVLARQTQALLQQTGGGDAFAFGRLQGHWERNLSAQSRKTWACNASGAVTGGRLFSSNSPQAAARSVQADWLWTTVRSCSRLCWASQPVMSAKINRTATTVR